MPAPAHASRSSREPDERLESGAPTPRNRPSLAYYAAPHTRDKSIRESLIDGAEPVSGEPELGEPVRDVAVASFGNAAILEAVIGNDDRVRVEPGLLKRNPWRQICALRITSSTGQRYVGTGWWIGPRVVATAGHCVYLQNEGGWAGEIEVIPAKAGASTPYGSIRSRRFHAVDGWVRGHEKDFDYGVIVLDDPTVGSRVGNFAVSALGDPELRGVTAKISGYPADRDRAEFQYFHERPLMSSSPSRLTYDVDTFGGQSGSPIWCDTEEAGLVAIGIHTTGGFSSNSGTRINQAVLENFILWSR